MSEFDHSFINGIIDELTRSGRMPETPDEVNAALGVITHQYNEQALPDFQGLSPTQVQTLMHDPFSPDSVVKLIAAVLPEVSSSPVMRISQVILSSIPDIKGLKLTAKGNLPRKVVEDIRSLKTYKSRYSSFCDDRVVNEQDYMPAIYTRALLTASALVIVRKNKLFLTKKGKSLMDDPVKMYVELLNIWLTQFNKAFFDRYDSEDIGNIAPAYALYLVGLYGDQKRETSFYSKLYFKAFPMLLDGVWPGISGPEYMAYSCFTYRVFDKGFHLFGLVEISEEGKDYSERNIVKTGLFDQVFEINKSYNSPEEKTVGRNDQCPCGSGKKFKNCCLKQKLN